MSYPLVESTCPTGYPEQFLTQVFRQGEAAQLSGEWSGVEWSEHDLRIRRSFKFVGTGDCWDGGGRSSHDEPAAG
jgi:hypothetical protein